MPNANTINLVNWLLELCCSGRCSGDAAQPFILARKIARTTSGKNIWSPEWSETRKPWQTARNQ